MKALAAAALLALTACSSHPAAPPATSLAPSESVGLAAPVAPPADMLNAAPVAPPADMLNPAVTQATITTTICKRGWTSTIRPPVGYTEPLKRLMIRSYGYTDRRLRGYEEDHAIALELGGDPTAHANLWPEPHQFSVPDDGLEGSYNSKVCKGTLTLADAQARLYAAKLAHGYDRAKSLTA